MEANTSQPIFFQVGASKLENKDLVEEIGLIMSVILSRAYFTPEGNTSNVGIQRSLQGFLSRYEIKDKMEKEAELFQFFKTHHILIFEENNKITETIEKQVTLNLNLPLFLKTILFIEDKAMLDILNSESKNLENILNATSEKPQILSNIEITLQIKKLSSQSQKEPVPVVQTQENQSVTGAQLETEQIKEIEEHVIHPDYAALKENEKFMMIRMHEKLRAYIVTKNTILNLTETLNMKFVVAESINYLLFDEVWKGKNFNNIDFIEQFIGFMVNQYLSPKLKEFFVDIYPLAQYPQEILSRSVCFQYKKIIILITQISTSPLKIDSTKTIFFDQLALVQSKSSLQQVEEESKSTNTEVKEGEASGDAYDYDEYTFEEEKTEQVQDISNQNWKKDYIGDGIFLKLQQQQSLFLQRENSLSEKNSETSPEIFSPELFKELLILKRNSSTESLTKNEEQMSVFISLLTPILQIEPALDFEEIQYIFNDRIGLMQIPNKTNFQFEAKIGNQADSAWRLDNETLIVDTNQNQYKCFFSYKALRVLIFQVEVNDNYLQTLLLKSEEIFKQQIDQLKPLGFCEITQDQIDEFQIDLEEIKNQFRVLESEETELQKQLENLKSSLAQKKSDEGKSIVLQQINIETENLNGVLTFKIERQKELLTNINRCKNHNGPYDANRRVPMIYSCGHSICYECAIQYNRSTLKRQQQKKCPFDCWIQHNKLKIHMNKNYFYFLAESRLIGQEHPSKEICAELDQKKMLLEYYVGEVLQEHESQHDINFGGTERNTQNSFEILKQAVNNAIGKGVLPDNEIASITNKVINFFGKNSNEITHYANPNMQLDLLNIINIISDFN